MEPCPIHLTLRGATLYHNAKNCVLLFEMRDRPQYLSHPNPPRPGQTTSSSSFTGNSNDFSCSLTPYNNQQTPIVTQLNFLDQLTPSPPSPQYAQSAPQSDDYPLIPEEDPYSSPSPRSETYYHDLVDSDDSHSNTFDGFDESAGYLLRTMSKQSAPFANDRLRPATPYSSTSENLTIFRNRSSSLEKSKILPNQISFAQPLLQKFQVQDSLFEDMTTAKCKSGLPSLAKIIGFAQIQAAV